jgi:hypothetical protein
MIRIKKGRIFSAHSSAYQRPLDVVGLVLTLPAAGTDALAVFDGAVRPLSLPGLLGSAPLPQPLLPLSVGGGGGGGQSVPATTRSSSVFDIFAGVAAAGSEASAIKAAATVVDFNMVISFAWRSLPE